MYIQFQISNNMALFINDLKKTAVEIHVECTWILKYRNIINSFFHNTGILFYFDDTHLDLVEHPGVEF